MTVLSEEIYLPQDFVEALTGKYYIFNIEKSILEQIYNFLAINNITYLKHYPLTEINHIVKNNLDVVLVDVSDFNTNKGKWEKQYYWFEISHKHIAKFIPNKFI